MRMFEQLSNKELLKEYRSYEDLIYGNNPCFGVKDLKIFHELARECDLREE